MTRDEKKVRPHRLTLDMVMGKEFRIRIINWEKQIEERDYTNNKQEKNEWKKSIP